MSSVEKRDWLLLFLRERPLDRIRLMKGLFLLWHRSGRNIEGFFEFVPYMYGPCSFALYNAIEAAKRERLVTQAPHPVERWAPYFLTAQGAHSAACTADKVDPRLLQLIRSIAAEVASTGFYELLRRVYTEAPDFASDSVLAQRTRE
jgi:hypothetical protein